MTIVDYQLDAKEQETYFGESFARINPSRYYPDEFSRTVRGVDWRALNALLNNTQDSAH